MLNARGEDAKVAVQSTADGFGWTLENLPEMSYLLVYGTTAASVGKGGWQSFAKVDGRVWLDADGLGSRPSRQPAGYSPAITPSRT